MESVIAVFVAVIVLVYLRRALWQFPAQNMSVPVEESLGVLANYASNELVPGRVRQRCMQVAQCQNSYLLDIVLSLLILSILLCYVTLYLLVHNVQMPEDDTVQEPIQCTNTGKAVTAIGEKDYPSPPN